MGLILEVIADWFTVAAGDKMARSARPWVFGVGLLGLIALAAMVLRLAIG